MSDLNEPVMLGGRHAKLGPVQVHQADHIGQRPSNRIEVGFRRRALDRFGGIKAVRTVDIFGVRDILDHRPHIDQFDDLRTILQCLKHHVLGLKIAIDQIQLCQIGKRWQNPHDITDSICNLKDLPLLLHDLI